MRTYVRVARDHDPARGSRRVLRVGRAARRSSPSRPTRHRRRVGRARRELRGQGVRDPNGDGRAPGAQAVPARGAGRAPHVGVLRGEQGRVRGVRGHDAARRGNVDRRGVPRRPRPPASRRDTGRDRRTAAAESARARRPAHHCRRGEDEVPREGRERRRQARRPARRSARRRARVPPSASGRATLGSRPGHRREAPSPRNPDRWPGRRAR